MRRFLVAIVLFTSCKVQHEYMFKPGDIVKVQNTRFLILDYNKSRKGYFYKAQDLKHHHFVEYFSQERM